MGGYAILVPTFSILNVPSSICEELRTEAQNLLKGNESVREGPKGSKLWYCSNYKKTSSPFPVKV